MRSRSSVVMARRFRCHVSILKRRFQDPTAVELAYRGAVEFLPGRAALRDGRDALPFAAFDLLFGDQHVAAPGVEVDADHVAGSQPGQTAAGGTLRRGVEDRGAV